MFSGTRVDAIWVLRELGRGWERNIPQNGALQSGCQAVLSDELAKAIGTEVSTSSV